MVIRNRKKWIKLAAVVITATAAAGTGRYLYLRGQLMSKATRVAYCKEWWFNRAYTGMFYRWINSDTLLCSSQGPEDSFLTPQFYTFTPATNQKNPLPHLTTDVIKNGGDIQSFRISPNGKQLLYAGKTGVYVEAFDGTPPSYWHINEHTDSDFSTLQWINDGQWVILNQWDSNHGSLPAKRQTELKIFDIQRQNSIVNLSVTPTETRDEMTYIIGVQSGTENPVIYTHPFGFGENGTGRDTFGVLDRNTGKQINQYYKFVKPLRFYSESVCLSPNGRRIAYFVMSQPKSRINAMLSRLLPKVFHKDQFRSDLFVSDLDGKNNKLIGTVQYSEDSLYGETIGELQWLPDGKQVSFRYNDALYKVDVSQ